MSEDYRTTGNPEEIIFAVCPHCGYGSTGWNVAFNTRMKIGHCLRCEAVIRETDIQLPDKSPRFLREMGALSVLRMRQVLMKYSRGLFMEPAHSSGVVFHSIFADECEVYLEYAETRKIPHWFITDGRACIASDLPGRLSFQVRSPWNQEQVIYWTGRAITEDMQPKYKNTTLAHIGSGDCVFNLDVVPKGHPVILCEGPISALSAGIGAVALLGHKVHMPQAEQICMFEPQDITYLVEDGIKEEYAREQLRKFLKFGYPLRNLYYAKLLNGDPNDDPGQMPEVLKGRVAYVTG